MQQAVRNKTIRRGIVALGAVMSMVSIGLLVMYSPMSENCHMFQFAGCHEQVSMMSSAAVLSIAVMLLLWALSFTFWCIEIIGDRATKHRTKRTK